MLILKGTNRKVAINEMRCRVRERKWEREEDKWWKREKREGEEERKKTMICERGYSGLEKETVVKGEREKRR